MKTNEVLTLWQGLQSLMENKDKSFPGRISYAINRNLRKLTPIVEDYNKARMSIILERGEPDPETPGVYSIKSAEDQQYVNGQIDALLDMDNTDIKLSMIKYKDIEDLSFSIAEMDILYPMIEEEED